MNTIEYHKTITSELKAVQDRIRNLVPNWLEDGMYKEVILKELIKNFIPKNFDIVSGYVAAQTSDRGIHLVSRQIDVIIYDNSFPVLFKKGELAIVTPDSVRAIIEVKSSTQSEPVAETLKKSNEKGQFIFEGKQDKNLPIFNGIFYYNLNQKTDTQIERYLTNDVLRNSNNQEVNKFVVDHISYGENRFYKFWKKNNPGNERNILYHTENLSFSFFISNLMSYLQPESVANNNFLWFPVDKSFNERILWKF